MHKTVKIFDKAIEGTNGPEILEAFDDACTALNDDSFTEWFWSISDKEFDKLLDAAVEEFVPNQVKVDPYQHLKYHGTNILGEEI